MDELRSAMTARFDAGELPGLVYGVAAVDGTTRVEAIGVKAFGDTEPMRRETVFRIASMTKPMLAAVAMMLVEDGVLALDEWSRPPAFPSGAAGLASTVDDVLAFRRFLLHGGVHNGRRLLSEESVTRMTTNHLTPAQIEGGGMLLDGHGWGYGMSVTVTPDEVSTPGRYGWDGGYGTSWRNDPHTGRVCVLLTQVSDVMWNGTPPEFARLALRSSL